MPHTFEDLQNGLPAEQFTTQAEQQAQEFLNSVEEPADIDSEASDIQDHLLRFCREAVRRHGTCRPVIAALVGLELQIFHPQWDTERQKDEEFHYINKYLADQDPSITVAALPGRYGQSSSPDPAIILVTRTREGKSMTIYPYRLTESDVNWLDPVSPDEFTTNVIRVPRAD